MSDTSATETLSNFRSGVRALHGQMEGVSSAFQQLHSAALYDGALSRAQKELMATVVSIVTKCDGCIVWHLDAALKAGATADEVREAVGVAVLMGGGPATYYGSRALAALDELA